MPKKFQAVIKKRTFPLQCILWVFALCCMVICFILFLQPVTVQESQNAAGILPTPALYPGDRLTQTFLSSKNHLKGIEIAFSYNEDISESTKTLIQVFRNETLIMEQPLTLSSLPDKSFIYFTLNEKNCLDEAFTISVKNITEPSGLSVPDLSEDAYSFSMLALDNEMFYLSNTADYCFNSTAYPERLLCRFTYFNGWHFYPALSAAFLIFLIALIISDLIAKHLHSQPENICR